MGKFDGTRILVVEDHPTMREAMRLVLEGEGFTIEEASDGDAALAMVRRDPPDLVFLDLNDSAPMNIWLHKQVLRKLAENGGTVPADLLD